MSELHKFDELSNEQMRQVDSVCVTFERALRSKEAVTIEQFLESIPDELQASAFQELLEIELEWLSSHSSEFDVSDYLARFPNRQDEIHNLVNDRMVQSSKNDQNGIRAEDSVGLFRLAEIPTTGTIIDERYTIIEPIGEGGMGSVYLAEQRTPVARQVAIKFIKGGLDSKAVLARFDIERSALAMMDHPGIAQVYDGGQTAGGLPYFVMELVRGVPMTNYCDQWNLNVRARLNLFVSVCKAVQHAHLKGIIHRDLKPGNILVSEVDGEPLIKVIDFGVAKAVDKKLTNKSLAATAMIVGTPAYMSPEQADPTSMDIDMRTDVYSLGVLFFELLAGTTPHDTDELPEGSILDFLRKVREIDSPKPSTKVSSAEKRAEIASVRSVEPDNLARLLRGELDWIALKALEKDRSRRYETVSSFARDVERYLAGEVVEARPPSNAYRMQKFVTRNKGLVIAASLLFLTLSVGVVGTGWGMLEAQKHAAAAKLEVIEKEAARQNEAREREYAEAIAEFVESDFLALTTLEGRLDNDVKGLSINKDSTLRELLDRASEKLNNRTDLAPHIEARLRWIIGRSYLRLAAFQNSIDSFEPSVKLYKSVLGDDDLKTLRAQDGLADALQSNGQHVRAQTLLKKTIARKKSLLGPEHNETLRSLSLLAANYRISGEPAKAVPMLEEILARTKSHHGPKHRQTLVQMYELALALNSADQPGKAMSLLEQTLKIQTETLSGSHPDIHASSERLGEMYYRSGQLEKAQPLLERGLEWSKISYGPESHSTIYAMSRLSSFYRNLRRLDLALPLAQQTLELTKKVFGADHPNVANTKADLARVYRAAGDHDKALPLFEEALQAKKAGLGENHPGTLIAMANVAACHRSMGQLEHAQQMNEKCLTLAKEILGEKHSQTISIKQNLAVGYWSAKNLDRSIPLFEEVLSYRETRNGRNHPSTLMAIANVGTNYRDAGRLDEAVPLLEEVYRAVSKNPSLGFVGPELLDAYLQAGQKDKGLALLSELIVDTRSKQPVDSLKLSSQLALLGKILLRSDALKQAEPLLRESMTIRQRLAPESWSTYDTVAMLGETLLKQEDYAEGEGLLVAANQGMKLHAATAPSIAKGRRATVLEQLIEAATAMDHPNDVNKWEAELASLAESDSK